MGGEDSYRRTVWLQILNDGVPLAERAISVPVPLCLALDGEEGAGDDATWPGTVLGRIRDVPLPPSTLANARRQARGLSGGSQSALVIRSGSPAEAKAVACEIAESLGRRALFVDPDKSGRPAPAASGLGPWLLVRKLIPAYCFELGPGERSHDRCCSSFYLTWIRVPTAHDPLWQTMCSEKQAERFSGAGSRLERPSDKSRNRLDQPLFARIATNDSRRANQPLPRRGDPPCSKGGRRRRCRELRIERQANDLVRGPFCYLACRFWAHRMPITHGNKAAMPRSQCRLKRPRLRFGVGKQRRSTAETGINIACDRGAA